MPEGRAERPVRPRIFLNTLLAVLLGLAALSGIAMAGQSIREIHAVRIHSVVDEDRLEVHRT